MNRFSHTSAMAFIFATVMLDVITIGIVTPVLPALVETFTGSNSRAGAIAGLFAAVAAFGQLAASPIIGSLSDRFGRRPLLLASTGGLAINYVIMALAPNLYWLAFARAIAGVTSSTFTVVYAYIADITSVERRTKVYGAVGAAYSAGLVAGPILGGWLGGISPRAPFWTAGIASVLAFSFGIVLLPESLLPKHRMSFSWRRANPIGALKLLRSHPELPQLALINFLMYVPNYAFSAIFVLYVNHRYHWSLWQVGVFLTLCGALEIVIQVFLVESAARVMGERRTIILAAFTGSFGMACMGFASTGLVFVLSVAPAIIRVLAMPMLQSLMTKRVSESEQGQLQGANTILSSIAGVISPLIFGIVYWSTVSDSAEDRVYSGIVMLLAAATLLIAGVVSVILERTHRQASSALA